MDFLLDVAGLVGRHRRKLIVFGVLGAGLYGAFRLRAKLREIEMEVLRDNERGGAILRRQFTANQRAAEAMFQKLVVDLHRVIRTEVDPNELIDQLKSGGLGKTEKVALWGRVKILAIQRLVVSVYASSITCFLLVMCFQLIGRYVGSQQQRNSHVSALPAGQLAMDTQRRLLSTVEDVRHCLLMQTVQLKNGRHDSLLNIVHAAVQDEVGHISLTAPFEKESFAVILAKIQRSISGRVGDMANLVFGLFGTQPDSEHLELADPNYQALLSEARDLAAGPDFSILFDDLLSAGLADVPNAMDEKLFTGDRKLMMAKALPLLCKVDLLAVPSEQDGVVPTPYYAGLMSKSAVQQLATIVFLSGEKE